MNISSKFSYIYLILNLIALNTFNCQVTDEFDPNNVLPPNKRRPTHFQEKAYCDTCIHVMSVAVHELAGKKSEMDCVDVIDRMFNREDMHKYIPDNVRLFAEHFISVFEEDVIQSLQTRENDKHAVWLACYQYSQVFYIL